MVENMLIKILANSKEYAVEHEHGKTVYNAILKTKAEFNAPCGGNGKCGKCKVKIQPAPPITKTEECFLTQDEILKGIRLACMCKPETDCTVYLPDISSAVVLTGGVTREFSLNPVCQGDYGVAIDIGTTTVATYLYNLKTGKEIDVYSDLNAQKGYGADVISRIDYVLLNKDGKDLLKTVIANQISNMINILLNKNNIHKDSLSGVMIVGNTTMLHLLCGFDVSGIAKAPFTPANLSAIRISAGELGLDINPNAQIFMPPCISGYIGADTVSAMIASNFDNETNCLLCDIGTNGEIVLSYKGKLYAAATAAGPAFEGANISYGMAGVEGAIDNVLLNNSDITLTTIANKPALGICGSGLLDLSALLIKTGIVDETGRMASADEVDTALSNRLKTDNNGHNIFMITDSVSFSAKDIRQLQLAKAAVAAGIRVLIKSSGSDFSVLNKLYLAGGFGNYLRKESATAIGLLPYEMLNKILTAGNAAGAGAALMLLDKNLYKKADEIARRCTYIELSESKEFMDEYIECMGF